MPRPAVRRPAPIVLPNYPMDTLWEVDESSDAPPQPPKHTSRFIPSEPLRSVFEDDDDEDMRNVSFPLPPFALPVRRFFSSRMSLPIHSPPKRTPPRPRRAPPPPPRVPSPVARPVSPTSSASSSDTELPRTPPTTSYSLPKLASDLPPPPPAEWESAIDALFDFAEEQDELKPAPVSRRSVPCKPAPTSRPSLPTRSPARRPSPPPVWSPVEGSSFVSMSPLSPTSTGWGPVDRPLMSPGFMPMSVSPPSQRWLSLAS